MKQVSVYSPYYGTSTYETTGRDQPDVMELSEKEFAREFSLWALAGWIEAAGLGTPSEYAVYAEITGPKGLSLEDTKKLLRAAVDAGYLKRKRTTVKREKPHSEVRTYKFEDIEFEED